jgi:bifunctional non-homologous end joining protein LigD
VTSHAIEANADRAVHEVKHDGYRLIVRRESSRVRRTRRGFNWSYRFPLIVQAVTRLNAHSVIIDGEAVSRPLEERKARLAKLLSNARHGIYFNEHLAENGATVFKHACLMGLEGIVSTRRDLPYR